MLTVHSVKISNVNFIIYGTVGLHQYWTMSFKFYKNTFTVFYSYYYWIMKTSLHHISIIFGIPFKFNVLYRYVTLHIKDSRLFPKYKICLKRTLFWQISIQNEPRLKSVDLHFLILFWALYLPIYFYNFIFMSKIWKTGILITFIFSCRFILTCTTKLLYIFEHVKQTFDFCQRRL